MLHSSSSFSQTQQPEVQTCIHRKRKSSLLQLTMTHSTKHNEQHHTGTTYANQVSCSFSTCGRGRWFNVIILSSLWCFYLKQISLFCFSETIAKKQNKKKTFINFPISVFLGGKKLSWMKQQSNHADSSGAHFLTWKKWFVFPVNWCHYILFLALTYMSVNCLNVRWTFVFLPYPVNKAS